MPQADYEPSADEANFEEVTVKKASVPAPTTELYEEIAEQPAEALATEPADGSAEEPATEPVIAPVEAPTTEGNMDWEQ